MSRHTRKGIETIGEAALRLLAGLDQRAKTSGEMPEQIQIGMRPLAEKAGRAATGDLRARPAVTCHLGEEERQGWPKGLFVHVDEGQGRTDRVLNRYVEIANDNASPALGPDGSVVPIDRAEDTLRGLK